MLPRSLNRLAPACLLYFTIVSALRPSNAGLCALGKGYVTELAAT
jgi:hypothetical protein